MLDRIPWRDCLLVSFAFLFYTVIAVASIFSTAWFVDIDDIPRLHAAALARKSIQNERIFAFAVPFSWNQVLGILRKKFPKREFPADVLMGR